MKNELDKLGNIAIVMATLTLCGVIMLSLHLVRPDLFGVYWKVVGIPIFVVGDFTTIAMIIIAMNVSKETKNE